MPDESIDGMRQRYGIAEGEERFIHISPPTSPTSSPTNSRGIKARKLWAKKSKEPNLVHVRFFVAFISGNFWELMFSVFYLQVALRWFSIACAVGFVLITIGCACLYRIKITCEVARKWLLRWCRYVLEQVYDINLHPTFHRPLVAWLKGMLPSTGTYNGKGSRSSNINLRRC